MREGICRMWYFEDIIDNFFFFKEQLKHNTVSRVWLIFFHHFIFICLINDPQLQAPFASSLLLGFLFLFVFSFGVSLIILLILSRRCHVTPLFNIFSEILEFRIMQGGSYHNTQFMPYVCLISFLAFLLNCIKSKNVTWSCKFLRNMKNSYKNLNVENCSSILDGSRRLVSGIDLANSS